MEGFPSLLWIPYMAKHYSPMKAAHSAPKTGSRRPSGAHHLAWSQWEHRNKILHDDDKPCARRAIQLLHRAIMMKLHQGTQDLPVQDHHHFHYCLADLLLNTTVYKQQWYLHIIAARAHNDRRAIAAGSLRPVTEADPRLDHWIHTNRLSNKTQPRSILTPLLQLLQLQFPRCRDVCRVPSCFRFACSVLLDDVDS
jgi:hypothetical protein